MSKLKQALVELGYKYPELRDDLRVLIAADSFQQVFGEVRSLLTQTPSQENFEKICLRVRDAYEEHGNRTVQEVVPYVKQILDRKYPISMRKLEPQDFQRSVNPTRKIKILLGKGGRALYISNKFWKDADIREALKSYAFDSINSVTIQGNHPWTNEEILTFVLNQKSIGYVTLTERNFKPGTLKRLEPLMSRITDTLSLEGSPSLDYDLAQELAMKYKITIWVDNPDENIFLSAGEIQEEFYHELRGMYDGPSKVEKASGGLVRVTGSFGNDADGMYDIVLREPKIMDRELKFDVMVTSPVKTFTKTYTFPRPIQDLREGLGGNRHVFDIALELGKLILDTLRG